MRARFTKVYVQRFLPLPIIAACSGELWTEAMCSSVIAVRNKIHIQAIYRNLSQGARSQWATTSQHSLGLWLLDSQKLRWPVFPGSCSVGLGPLLLKELGCGGNGSHWGCLESEGDFRPGSQTGSQGIGCSGAGAGPGQPRPCPQASSQTGSLLWRGKHISWRSIHNSSIKCFSLPRWGCDILERV